MHYAEIERDRSYPMYWRYWIDYYRPDGTYVAGSGRGTCRHAWTFSSALRKAQRRIRRLEVQA